MFIDDADLELFIAHAEQPYNDMQTAIDTPRKMQSFEPALTERFIAIQTRRDEL